MDQLAKLEHLVTSVRLVTPEQLVRRVRQVRSEMSDNKEQPDWLAVLDFPDLLEQLVLRVISDPLGNREM
jgi:hypothetical protein